jgi:hypothetical protein
MLPAVHFRMGVTGFCNQLQGYRLEMKRVNAQERLEVFSPGEN